MTKIIKSGLQAKLAVKAGVDIAANVIKATLGPTGKAIILDKGFGSPVISDDGVTVAKDIELEDKFENVGASLIQEVANKTNDEAGDGTTTATVLAQKMIEQGFEAVAINSARAVDVKKGMEKAVKFVVEELQKVKKEVTTKEELEQVATIASLDAEVGKLIAEAMEEVGKDGVITVEEGQSIGLEKEVVKGMRFDKGFVSGYMVTNPERMEAVWEDPYILITDKKVSSLQDILPVLEKGSIKQQKLLSKWPIEMPKNYIKLVNEPQTNTELETLRYSVNKGKPYGSDHWIDKMIDRFKLGATLRNPGRPKKGS
jgi:chaperonin GroEL